MATSLRNHINDLASVFAVSVLNAIRGASLEDLLSETTAGGGRRGARGRRAATQAPAAAAGRAPRASRGRGRLARRSAADIAGVIDKIVGLLKQSPRGLRAEQIRARLGLLAKEMPRPLKEALATGRIGKSGQKRSTVYFLKGAGAPARAAGAKKAKASAPAKARKAGRTRSKGAGRAKSRKSARRAKAKPSAKRASRPRRRSGKATAKRARPAKPGKQAKRARRGGAKPAPPAAAAGGAPSPAPGAAS